jgi:Fe-S-cluster-containing dehydrogenase component/DMSO reductase anchor subunit
MEENKTQFPIRPISLVKEALQDQQTLTAVERFSQRKDSGQVPEQSKYYKDLIPLSHPKPGEQYAFEVDLDACTGCKACVSACHSLNGLDENETWRSVGLLNGGTPKQAYSFIVTTACHHCLEPACLTGCPTKAYEKDPKTGVVKHLDDQCFGCQYCTLMCPYEVPQYNARLGIVRKCDMCHSRLSEGEAPACVQACPSQAIRIKITSEKQVRATAKNQSFLPGAPDPKKTLPTTDYKTKFSLPKNLLPADYYSVTAAQAHSPLVLMLVFTQLAIGTFSMQWACDFFFECLTLSHLSFLFAILTFVLGQVALVASLFHLGRPFYAFRAVLGLKTSWLSREIVAMGLFTFSTFGYALCFALNRWTSFYIPESLFQVLGTLTVLAGMVAIGTSVMVYRVTKRECWNTMATTGKFFLSAFVSGSSFLFLVLHAFSLWQGEMNVTVEKVERVLLGMLLSSTLLKVGIECSILRHLKDQDLNPFKRSAILLMGELRRIFKARLLCALLGLLVFAVPFIFRRESGGLNHLLLLGAAVFSFVFLLMGEIFERYLFFTAEGSNKMPGAYQS